MTLAVSAPATGDYRIDALLAPQHWAPASGRTIVTYSFPSATAGWSGGAGEYGAGGTSEPMSPQFAMLDADERAGVRAALGAWSAVVNVEFAEVAESSTVAGTLRFAWTGMSVDQQSTAYAPGALQKAGDVWLNALAEWATYAPGSYEFSTLLHEIGHALGLKHPFEDGATLPPAEEAYPNTLMSYTASARSPGSWSSFEPTTPMLYDVLAIQRLYGANAATGAGDDLYVFAEGQSYFQTIWDAGGTDTVRWDATGQGAAIDLQAGRFSELGNAIAYWSADGTQQWSDPKTVAIAFGVTIENAVGGDAADRLQGNAAANVMLGRGGNDLLNGGGGGDTMHGGAGDDTMSGGAGNDVLQGEGGVDVAVFAGARAGYTVAKTGARFVVTDRTGAEGVDTLLGMETIRFGDVALPLANPPLDRAPSPRQDPGFLFDAVHYLLANSALAGTVTAGTAWQHWLQAGAAQELAPTSWFDATYYGSKWGDLSALDDATLFMHFNLYGVWEGRAPGPRFDRFDGERYLAQYADVAQYVDAHVTDFLGSRSNGAIAHFLIYGANEQREAFDQLGPAIDLGYVL